MTTTAESQMRNWLAHTSLLGLDKKEPAEAGKKELRCSGRTRSKICPRLNIGMRPQRHIAATLLSLRRTQQMAKSFKVIDIRDDTKEHWIDAKSAEEAGEKVVGLPLTRSGVARNLKAKVYWQPAPDKPQLMTRLYQRVIQS